VALLDTTCGRNIPSQLPEVQGLLAELGFSETVDISSTRQVEGFGTRILSRVAVGPGSCVSCVGGEARRAWTAPAERSPSPSRTWPLPIPRPDTPRAGTDCDCGDR